MRQPGEEAGSACRRPVFGSCACLSMRRCKAVRPQPIMYLIRLVLSRAVCGVDLLVQLSCCLELLIARPLYLSPPGLQLQLL